MHPAYSVILFTTASGAGYGLLMLICLACFTGVLPESPVFWICQLGTFTWVDYSRSFVFNGTPWSS
jgi:DMSO reductase anchor subunit